MPFDAETRRVQLVTLILNLAESRVARSGGAVKRAGQSATLTFVVTSLDVALLDVATTLTSSDQSSATWIVIDVDPGGAPTDVVRKIVHHRSVTLTVGVTLDSAGTLVVESARRYCCLRLETLIEVVGSSRNPAFWKAL